jgi:hypothetical protein
MIGVGDVLCTRGNSRAAFLIRLGAAFRDRPNSVNHVAVVHHLDANGVWWAVEGRPGGVGWVDATSYLTSPWTISNAEQPKDEGQRKQVADTVVQMLGTPYDWHGIAADAFEALHLKRLWKPRHGTVPGHVVCSSLADYAYAAANLPNPGKVGFDDDTTPGDWAEFITLRRWLHAP